MLDKYAPSVAPIKGFYGWFSLFMPIPLLLFFFQLGGFRKNFRPTAFSTGILVIVAFIPILTKMKTLLGV